MANAAELAERFEDMLNIMKLRFSKENNEMTVEERNIVSVAYKNLIGSKRV